MKQIQHYYCVKSQTRCSVLDNLHANIIQKHWRLLILLSLNSLQKIKIHLCTQVWLQYPQKQHIPAYTFFFFFNTWIVPLGFLPQEILAAFPGDSQLSTVSHYPIYGTCWVFFCFYNPSMFQFTKLWHRSHIYRIFSVHTDINACDCTQGCKDTISLCTESWLWEKNSLLHRGIKSASVACQSDALPTELSLSLFNLYLDKWEGQLWMNSIGSTC